MSNTPDIQWLESGEPYSRQFQDYYFSTDGGFRESEYVFLKPNRFPERFYQTENNHLQEPLKIGETGFGTGLNFLVTLYHWLQSSKSRHPIHYISVEKFPFSKAQLTRIYTIFIRQWPQLSQACTLFLDSYPDSLSQQASFKSHFLNGHFKISLLTGDAQQQLAQLLPANKQSFDAWYLDGFAPARNPEMWHQELFNTLYLLSKPGTTLSSFTAAGFVRRGLTEAGFSIKKTPGLGKKRENLFGHYLDNR